MLGSSCLQCSSSGAQRIKAILAEGQDGNTQKVACEVVEIVTILPRGG